MKNIHLIPTDKPSELYLHSNNELQLRTNIIRTSEDYLGTNQHIYITSDEEIKEGEWYLVELFKITGESDGFHIEKCTKLDDVWCNNFDVISTRHKDDCKKIILTTDQDLIKDGVQAINDEFLEWFVKNPSCEEVKVNTVAWESKGNILEYKIIIPQEEPKLINNCPKCGLDLVEREGSKPVCTRIDCGGIILSNSTLREWALKEESKQLTDLEIAVKLQEIESEEPKQETLEEVAERLYSGVDRQVDRMLFIAGAKFQAERMYSEEDLREAYKACYTPFSFDRIGDLDKDFSVWFEQFKKK